MPLNIVSRCTFSVYLKECALCGCWVLLFINISKVNWLIVMVTSYTSFMIFNCSSTSCFKRSVSSLTALFLVWGLECWTALLSVPAPSSVPSKACVPALESIALPASLLPLQEMAVPCSLDWGWPCTSGSQTAGFFAVPAPPQGGGQTLRCLWRVLCETLLSFP